MSSPFTDERTVRISGSNELLRSISRPDAAALNASVRAVHLRRGQVLYDVGDDLQWLYFPDDSLVALLSPMRSGRHVAHTIRGRDGAVGLVEAAGSGHLFCRVEVLVGGRAWKIPVTRWREQVRQSVDLAEQVSRRTELALMAARQSVACQASHTAHQRTARLLLECMGHTGERRVALTQDLIGELTGLGRTTISQTLNEFGGEGVLELHRGSFRLLRPEALEAIACECYRAVRNARACLLDAARQS